MFFSINIPPCYLSKNNLIKFILIDESLYYYIFVSFFEWSKINTYYIYFK
jgi:hypothetical protein